MNTRNEWLIDGDAVTDIFFSKDETIQSVKSNFDIRRYNSAEGCSVTIDGIVEQVIVQDHHNPINESDVDKKMLLSMTSTAETGSYVVYRNKTWMIISNINIVDDAYKSCQIQYCNYILKWQNSTGTILSYPCITSKNTFNQDESKIITLPANQKAILLPYNDDTSTLLADKRMYVDKRNKSPYKIIGDLDTTTYNYGDKGLISFVMEQSPSQDNTALPDRPDLGICNYIEPTTPPTPSPSGYTMTITPNSDLTVNSSFWCVFTPVLKDGDGNIVTNWTPVWTVNYNGMDINKFTIQYVGKTCQVKCVDDTYDIVDKIITLTCKKNDDETVSKSFSAIIVM